MEVHILTIDNVDMLIKLEQAARVSEPEIFIDDFDARKCRAGTEAALKNPLYASARCMICVNEEGQAVGRVDFTIVPSFSFGGTLEVYVAWVYVLKEFRHQGVAQLLFSQMEAYIKEMGIGEYFLLMAENAEAQSFYRNIKGAEIKKYDVLRVG